MRKKFRLFKDDTKEGKIEDMVDYQNEKLQLNTKSIIEAIVSEAKLSNIEIDSKFIREIMRQYL